MINVKMKIQYWLLPLACLLFTACNDVDEQEKEIEKPCLTQADLAQLKPISAEKHPIVRRLRLSGKVNYNPGAVIHYASSYSGTVQQTYFSLGDKVRKGQVMAEIQSGELNSMYAEVQKLEVKLNVAERELEAIRSFYEDELVSERELVSAQSEREAIETELLNLRRNLELLSSSSETGVHQIRAPQSGYIVESRLVSGMRFGADGDPLFTISDLDKVWVSLNVYATEIDLIKKGMPVSLTTSSYPGKTFEARIDHLSSVIDEGDNVLKARAVLDNKELFLKPGLHLEAMVEIQSEEEAIRLPASAVVFHNNSNYAVILDHCNTWNIPLTILYADEKYVYLKNGIEPGDQFISKNALLQFEDAHSAGRHK